jgi:2,3-bisphosphoglycerate-independent phosphoglycerate mutase
MVTAGRKPKPVVLCLLDGFGEREARDGNAVRLARTSSLGALRERFGATNLDASGEAVGLVAGKAGSGALGYEAIGTGRTPAPAARRVDRAIEEKKLGANAVVTRTMWIANDRSCRLHLFLPVSESGAHASMSHLRALLSVTEAHDVKVVVHAFLDESASAPKSAWKRLDALGLLLDGRGTIGTVAGGMFALDRSGRWDLVQRAYTAIVRGEANRKETAYEALEEAYEKGRTDWAVEPVRIGEYEGMKGEFMSDFSSGKPAWTWFGEEVGLFLGTRPDRVHELASMFVRQGVPPEVEEFLTERGKAIHAFDEFGLLSLTDIDRTHEKVLAAFPNEAIEGTLADAIAGAGLSMMRVAEADRARHVSRLFDGRDGERRAREELVIVPEEESERRAVEAVERAIEEGRHDVVVVAFGGADRAARRGDVTAAVAAVEAIDEAIGRLAAKIEAHGGALFVAGTHGAAEEMLDQEGTPRGEHTTNPVPLFYANASDAGGSLASGGRLEDVAPTVLDVLGVEQPKQMTGRSLRTTR